VSAAARVYAAAVEATLTPEMAAGRELRRAQARHPAVFHAVFALPVTRRVFVDALTGATGIDRVFAHRSVRVLTRLLQRI